VSANEGLQVRSSELVSEGTQIWMRGGEVIAVTTTSRTKFLGQFGLVTDAPIEATGVVVSAAEYARLVAKAVHR
jgi:hypothetical protein